MFDCEFEIQLFYLHFYGSFPIMFFSNAVRACMCTALHWIESRVLTNTSQIVEKSSRQCSIRHGRSQDFHTGGGMFGGPSNFWLMHAFVFSV